MISLIVTGRNDSRRLPPALDSIVRVVAATAPPEIIDAGSNSAAGTFKGGRSLFGRPDITLDGPRQYGFFFCRPHEPMPDYVKADAERESAAGRT